MEKPPLTSQRNDWGAHLRGGWVAIWLWQGSKLSDKEVGLLCGISRQHAWRMMLILAAGLPIVKVNGKWQWFDKDAE
jgi:hypothetical protein